MCISLLLIDPWAVSSLIKVFQIMVENIENSYKIIAHDKVLGFFKNIMTSLDVKQNNKS